MAAMTTKRNDCDAFRELVEACEAEFGCGQMDSRDENGGLVFPDDDAVSYPEEQCHITFGHIRRARAALTTKSAQISSKLVVDEIPAAFLRWNEFSYDFIGNPHFDVWADDLCDKNGARQDFPLYIRRSDDHLATVGMKITDAMVQSAVDAYAYGTPSSNEAVSHFAMRATLKAAIGAKG